MATGSLISVFSSPSVTNIVARTSSTWWHYTPTSIGTASQTNNVLHAPLSVFS